MQFAESGVEALTILDASPFDAIVSDMRMPGMDGAQLLDEVKNRHPELIRFVLSGHSDQELIMRSVGPSHQYLSKPCEPEVLKRHLGKAFALQQLLLSDNVRRLIAGMTSLPSLPDIYQAVIEELQSPDASIKTIGQLFEKDPGMSAKVLQLVNSAYFGIRRHIASPAEAANFLGLNIIKSLVLSEGIFSQFNPEIVRMLSLDVIKSHSLQIASAARNIARTEDVDECMIDQAFLAGLLLDMGSLILAANLPEQYIKARELQTTCGISIWAAEKEITGTTHAEIGAYTLGLWGIDNDVVAAVAYHHCPWLYPTTEFCALTAVYIATCLIDNNSQNNQETGFSEEGLAYLEKINPDNNISRWQEICNLTENEDAA